MKIIIEHYGVKRKLEGTGFNLCGSQKELMEIADQIKKQAGESFHYGWIQIRDSLPDDHFSGPNSVPLPWPNSANPKKKQTEQ